MGTGYTRNDTSDNIAEGKVASAADIDGEFNAIVAAFDASTGHTHDGTSAEGGPITVIGPAQDFVAGASDLSPKTDSTHDLGKTGTRFATGYFDALDTTTLLVDGKSFVRDAQEFISSGTWTKPSGITFVLVELVAGGGGGANQTGTQASGGAGGEYVSYLFDAADLGATETVTIGAGGAGGASGGSNGGSAGGDTTFGTHATAKGGNGGGASTSSRGTLGRASNTTSSDSIWRVLPGIIGGVGGYDTPGHTVKGGGGGEGFVTTGRGVGISEFHGNGGVANGSAGVAAGNGESPGGGGGGSANDGGGGTGGDGWCRVISW